MKLNKFVLMVTAVLLVSANAYSKPSRCIGRSSGILRWDVDFISQNGDKRTLRMGTTVKIINYPAVENTSAIIQVAVESAVAYENRDQSGQIRSCSAGIVNEPGIIPWGSNWLRGPFDCNLED